MLIKYHNSDYKKLQGEEKISKAIQDSGNPIGFYTMPYCEDMKEMADPTVQEKFKKGPIAIITIMENGLPNMGKLLTQQLMFFILGSLIIGYIGTLALTKGAVSLDIFHILFVVGFIGFGWASIPYSIWFGHPWSVTLKYLVDAIIYSAVIAATYTWLWPSAV
jgi:hypothetical protein